MSQNGMTMPGPWFSGSEGPQALFAGRTLSLDDSARSIWARLMADRKAAGLPRSNLDMIEAAVSRANECVIVTDNENNHSGIQFFNPIRMTN